MQRLIHPGRSFGCQHRDCFDVDVLIKSTPESFVEYTCPICDIDFDLKVHFTLYHRCLIVAQELFIGPFIVYVLSVVTKGATAIVNPDGTVSPENELSLAENTDPNAPVILLSDFNEPGDVVVISSEPDEFQPATKRHRVDDVPDVIKAKRFIKISQFFLCANAGLRSESVDKSVVHSSSRSHR